MLSPGSSQPCKCCWTGHWEKTPKLFQELQSHPGQAQAGPQGRSGQGVRGLRAREPLVGESRLAAQLLWAVSVTDVSHTAQLL